MLATLPALAETAAVEPEGPLAPCGQESDTASEGSDQQANKNELPWGVEIAAAFSKEEALDRFNRMKQDHAAVLGDFEPMLVATCNLHMGTKLQYSARIGAETREAADKICASLQANGGACLVQKN